MSTITPPASLPWTGNAEADTLIAADPNALLIGFVLDQQVTVQKAFSGPLDLKRRLGNLDPGKIAATDPATLEQVFREKPAIHRFPGSMAQRVQAMCAFVAERYDGDAGKIWTEATSGTDLQKRLGEVPGIGDMKVRSLIATLVKQYGVHPEGYAEVTPTHPTLGDVTTAEELAEYQAGKRAAKAARRAAAAK
jgi:uncharacterized HhH-GPD family protein